MERGNDFKRLDEDGAYLADCFADDGPERRLYRAIILLHVSDALLKDQSFRGGRWTRMRSETSAALCWFGIPAGEDLFPPKPAWTFLAMCNIVGISAEMVRRVVAKARTDPAERERISRIFQRCHFRAKSNKPKEIKNGETT